MGEFNQAKYIQQFQKENYDRCIFNVPKGRKAIIEEHWRAKGYKSLNSYVNALIEQDMTGEKRTAPAASVNVNGNSGLVVGNNSGPIHMGGGNCS